MKTLARHQRHARVRSVVSGTAERPRLVMFRGTKSLAAQLVDDTTGKTILTVREKAGLAAAEKLGAAVVKAAKQNKVAKVVFDRAGYQYHGAVKAVAEAVRQEGMLS